LSMRFFPFDLTGPQFLVFYPIFAIGVAGLVRYLFAQREEVAELVLPRLTDPYRIALLRDGRREAVRIAVLALVERGLLAIKPGGAISVASTALDSVKDPLEHAVLRFFTSESSPSLVAEAPRVQTVAAAMESGLEAKGLLSTGGERFRRIAPAVAIPLLVALLRIGLSGPPFFFLLLEMIVFAVFGAMIADQRVTALGRSTLEHLQALFRHTRSRAVDLQRQSSGGESQCSGESQKALRSG